MPALRVKQSSPERLVLTASPWPLALGLGGVLALCAGLAVLAPRLAPGNAGQVALGAGIAALAVAGLGVLLLRRVIVFLDRAAGVVLIRSRRITGETEDSFPLARLVRAEVESSTLGDDTGSFGSDRRGGKVHRPVLRLDDGTLRPWSPVFVSGGGAARLVAAINAWMAQDPLQA